MPGADFGFSIHTPILLIFLPIVSAYLLLIAVAVVFVIQNILTNTIKQKPSQVGAIANLQQR